MTDSVPDENKKVEAAKQSAATKLGLALNGEQVQFTGQSLLTSLGGWLGIVESIIPTVAFGISYSVSQSVLLSFFISGGLSVLFIARQLIGKAPLSQAIAGLFALGVTAFFTLRPGASDVDYFVRGLLTNAIYGSVLLLSVLIRWPVIGLLVGLLKDQSVSWRKDKALSRRYTAVTLMWVGLFAIRLAFEYPLFAAGNLEALTLVKTILGVPFYALVLWLSWLSLRSVIIDKR
ncbi:MAG: DUF3159 domain-containing protein [Micrococcales bacterium]